MNGTKKIRTLAAIAVFAMFGLLFADSAKAQCQNQGSNVQSNAQVQQLTQQLQQLQNQLLQQQQAIQLTQRAPRPARGTAETQVAQSRPIATASDRIVARQMSTEEILASRGYTKRISADGRVQWITSASNPDKLTAAEMQGFRVRKAPALSYVGGPIPIDGR